ncbi:hypothetical protein chiPu_0028681, partial [Chiloscyllium punctatum]|nr:hypothetical protein [Chiloscyllium punctatum]
MMRCIRRLVGRSCDVSRGWCGDDVMYPEFFGAIVRCIS